MLTGPPPKFHGTRDNLTPYSAFALDAKHTTTNQSAQRR